MAGARPSTAAATASGLWRHARRRYVQVLWQARQVLRWVNRKNPGQYGFDIGLWTRHIVREVGQAAILSALESSLDRRGACQTKSDTAEATAARLPNSIPTRWHPGSARPTPRSHVKPSGTKAKSTSWASRAFASMRCMERRGGKRQPPVGSVLGQRQSTSATSAVRAKVSELGSRRTCAILLRLQMAVYGSLARPVKTFASTRKHLPERALHSAAWYYKNPDGHVRSTVVGADPPQLLGHHSRAFTPTS